MAKLLIVDDSRLSRRILRSILEPAGYQIAEAEDGIAALEKYFVDKPDLVLLDLTMDGMYGLDVLTKLRQMDPQARVLITSADIQSQTHAIAKAEGAVGYIDKPFAPGQVLSTVDTVLKGAM